MSLNLLGDIYWGVWLGCGILSIPWYQRRYDTRHKMLTQHTRYWIDSDARTGTLSQNFVMHVMPPAITRAPTNTGVGVASKWLAFGLTFQCLHHPV